MRVVFRAALASLLAVGAGDLAEANSAADTPSGLLAECSHPLLPERALNSCLERTRTLESTNASPELQSLMARLERQVDQNASREIENEKAQERTATAAPHALAAPSPDTALAAPDPSDESEDVPDFKSLTGGDTPGGSDVPPSDLSDDDQEQAPVIDPGDDPGPPSEPH